MDHEHGDGPAQRQAGRPDVQEQRRRADGGQPDRTQAARIAAPLRVTNGIVNAGVANLTKQLAGHAAGHAITINCVHPGPTETDRMTGNLARRAADAGVGLEEMTARAAAEIPLGRLIQPADIAAVVLFFCSPGADMITGQSIAVDGGGAIDQLLRP